MVLSFFVVTLAVAWNLYTVRSAVKWLALAHRYKADVLAQSNATGELKHIEWDGWGWAGQDTTVYLVFDPTDALSTASKNHVLGHFYGIPCEVVRVRKLEHRWYTVQFYTNEFWGRRNELDCTGSGH